MRYNHVDTIVRMIASRNYPKDGESLWLIVTLIDYILYKSGYNLDCGFCPFCGRRVRNMYRHLVWGRGRCHRKLRALIKDIMSVYYECLRYMDRVKKRNKTHIWKCKVCGYTGKGDEVLLHVYEEHLRHLLVPVK